MASSWFDVSERGVASEPTPVLIFLLSPPSPFALIPVRDFLLLLLVFFLFFFPLPWVFQDPEGSGVPQTFPDHLLVLAPAPPVSSD